MSVTGTMNNGCSVIAFHFRVLKKALGAQHLIGGRACSTLLEAAPRKLHGCTALHASLQLAKHAHASHAQAIFMVVTKIEQAAGAGFPRVVSGCA